MFNLYVTMIFQIDLVYILYSLETLNIYYRNDIF